MKEIITYLNFDGNCREAMKFYEQCLGGELQLMPFSEGQLYRSEAEKNLAERGRACPVSSQVVSEREYRR